tara:strand:+ start:479 stop:670 length:192 start_codon:yes stop_codon:yes gene_type:complete
MGCYRGKEVVFIESCGPIPEGSSGLCLEHCDKKGVVRLWLHRPVLGINEFVISRKHIKKIREI